MVSPYITSEAVVAAARKCSAVSKRIVTRFDGADIVAGATNLRVVAGLLEAGFAVRVFQDIHAKVYLLDDWAYVGSANLTTRGLQESLREFGRASEHAEEVAVAAHYFETLWGDATELSMPVLDAALRRLDLARSLLEKSLAVQRHVARDVTEGASIPAVPSERAQSPLNPPAGRPNPVRVTSHADGVVEFHDVEVGSAHDQFMNWRRENEAGFYLTMKSRQHANLHEAVCKHQGNYDFGEYPGSATRDRKICSRDHRVLYVWAQEHEIEIHRCKTCNPPEL